MRMMDLRKEMVHNLELKLEAYDGKVKRFRQSLYRL